jgi:biotin synthase-like enzyme
MRQKSQKGFKTDEVTLKTPIILKTGKQRDRSKQCDYCKTTQWKGIRHIESECFTKKREQKSAKEAKASEETEDDEEEGVYIGAIKIRLAIPRNPMDGYKYDTGTATRQ